MQNPEDDVAQGVCVRATRMWDLYAILVPAHLMSHSRVLVLVRQVSPFSSASLYLGMDTLWEPLFFHKVIYTPFFIWYVLASCYNLKRSFIRLQISLQIHYSISVVLEQ